MSKPKYRAIADQLREECITLAEGSQLPPEKELASRHGVSPMTLRQALDVLEDEGLITRVLARGTYVQKRVVAKGDSLTSFSDDMRIRGLEPSTRLLGVDVLTAPDPVAMDLKLRSGERVVEIERLRLANDEPMCLETSHLPERFAEVVTGAPDGSLHAALQEAGAAPEAGSRRIKAVAASDRAAMLLGIRVGTPALHIVQIFTDVDGRPVQRADAIYRADRYEAHSRIHRS